MYNDDVNMILESVYEDGYYQALADMGYVVDNDEASEDVDIFDENYFDDAMEGNPVNKAKRREWEMRNGKGGLLTSDKERIRDSREKNNVISKHVASYGVIKFPDESRTITDSQRHLNRENVAKYADDFRRQRDERVRRNGISDGYARRAKIIIDKEKGELDKIDNEAKRISRKGYDMPDYNKRKRETINHYKNLREKNNAHYDTYKRYK